MVRQAQRQKGTRRESPSVAAGLCSCTEREYPYLLWALWLVVVGSGFVLLGLAPLGCG
jgi:hypothetical protein